MFVLFEHQTMVEVGTAPVFTPHVEQILEGVRSKDAAAVKVALIEVLKRWDTPRPRMHKLPKGGSR